MRLLWLADVLRGAGLIVHEYADWKTRGLESFGPVRGIVCHGTNGSLTSTDAGELRTIAITGSNSATAPIAQLYLSRSGAWWVVASGTCTGVTLGTGGPLYGYGDDTVLQIEAQHSSVEPWSETQYRSYVRGVAALAAYKTAGYDVPLSNVIGHGEHQPGKKTDPWFDMAQFRRDVAAVLEGDEMTPAQAAALARMDGRMAALYYGMPDNPYGDGPMRGEPNAVRRQLDRLEAAAAADATRDAATHAAVTALADAIKAGGGSIETGPILARIDSEAAATRALVEQTHQAEMAQLRRGYEAELAGLRAELERLAAGA